MSQLNGRQTIFLLISIIFSILMVVLYLCGPIGVLISGVTVSILSIIFLVYALYAKWVNELVDKLIYGSDWTGE